MDEQTGYTLLDVRTQSEFDEGATILVYCRSGRRSKLAAQALSDLGYTKVHEFGGIIDWPYDIVK